MKTMREALSKLLIAAGLVGILALMLFGITLWAYENLDPITGIVLGASFGSILAGLFLKMGFSSD